MRITLPSPKEEAGKSSFNAVGKVTASVTSTNIQPYGVAFAEWLSAKHKVNDSADEDVNDRNEEAGMDLELIPIDADYIATCDAANWRNQDHYKLMGLQKYRYKATPEMIKQSYKKQVLWHHPDRKSSSTWSEKDRAQADVYFTCVKKAYEILSDPVNRRLYDSIDDFDEVIPAVTKKEEKFYKDYAKAFERNAKWFWPKEAPLLGDKDSTQDYVDEFYNFWYNEKSWREFGYFDEEVANETDSREQKRWVDKKNKAARKKKQKEDKARMIKLVDNAYASDPRVKAFKQAAKQAKIDAANKKKEEAEAKIAAAKKVEEEAAAAKQAQEKNERETKKASNEAYKRAKKAFAKAFKRYGLVTEAWKINDETPELAKTFTEDEVTLLKGKLNTEQLKAVVACEDVDSFIAAVREELDIESGKKKREDAVKAPWSQDEQKLLETALKEIPATDSNRWEKIAEKIPNRTVKAIKLRIKELVGKAQEKKDAPPVEWTEEEEKVVVKAASKIFPPGTQEIGGKNRWEQIADYLQTHAHTTWKRSHKEIIARVNMAKDVNAGLKKKQANFDAHADFEKQKAKGRDKSVLPDP